jgi:hypothetical protein
MIQTTSRIGVKEYCGFIADGRESVNYEKAEERVKHASLYIGLGSLYDTTFFGRKCSAMTFVNYELMNSDFH